MGEPLLASGTGNAAEALMDVNPTIVIPEGGVLQVNNYIATYAGSGGVIRIRETDLNGTELCRFNLSAAGQIQGDFRVTPMQFRAPRGATRTLVVTQEGTGANSLLLVGN